MIVWSTARNTLDNGENLEISKNSLQSFASPILPTLDAGPLLTAQFITGFFSFEFSSPLKRWLK